MKCADCPVNDGYCVFVSETRKRCPIPLLRERRIKAKYDQTPTYCPNCGIYTPANQPCRNVGMEVK